MTTFATQQRETQSTPNSSIHHLVSNQLLQQRTIILWGVVDDDSVRPLVEQLFFLNGQDTGQPIRFIINSPGGMVTAGSALLDVMASIQAPVHTYCMGNAASMAAILFSAGTPGQRYVYPHAEIMIHQPSMGSFSGRLWEIESHARQIIRAKKAAATLLATNCGKTADQIMDDFDKDYWMDAEEAIAYGIADALVPKHTAPSGCLQANAG